MFKHSFNNSATYLLAALLPAWASLSVASAQPLDVPGTSNVWLAGMPAGTESCRGDRVPDQSPVLIRGARRHGALLRITAVGAVSHGGGASFSGPDGDSDNVTTHTCRGSENGIADITAPFDSLIGVFLGGRSPDSTDPPAPLDFATPASRDYLILEPELKQPFFIGDGVTSGGEQQFIRIPRGAARLFLGTMDSTGWYNNLGAFQVCLDDVCRADGDALGGLDVHALDENDDHLVPAASCIDSGDLGSPLAVYGTVCK